MKYDLKYVVAPMVEQSELAWRMMMRNHKATLCYTPMINGSVFIQNETYRLQELDLHALDHPVIVQFAANTPDMFTCCAKIVEFKCEGVDLNLGCPQNIARKGHYGCFLHDEWQLIHDMIRQASSNLSIPVSAKIRIFDSIQKSVDYARMLENSGCSMLAVHGRTRNQKGQNTGLADWEIIKIIKQTLSIPVISNGNILYHSDIQRCIDYTGADGVMVAEGCLYNPYIFEDITVSTCAAAFEYIKYAQKYDAKPHAWRCHLFKILYHVFNIIPEMRKELADVKDLMSAKLLINKISSILDKRFSENLGLDWTCKPYIRKSPPSIKNEN